MLHNPVSYGVNLCTFMIGPTICNLASDSNFRSCVPPHTVSGSQNCTQFRQIVGSARDDVGERMQITLLTQVGCRTRSTVKGTSSTINTTSECIIFWARRPLQLDVCSLQCYIGIMRLSKPACSRLETRQGHARCKEAASPKSYFLLDRYGKACSSRPPITSKLTEFEWAHHSYGTVIAVATWASVL